MPASELQSSGSEHPANERLDSWKEIAAFLRRGERTVRRWEQTEGLPVHRHPHQKQATVYAFKSELSLWLSNRWNSIDSPDGRSEESEPEQPQKRNRAIPAVLGLCAILAAGILILGFSGGLRRARQPIIARPFTTFPGSEHNPGFSPDGKFLAFSWAKEIGGLADIYVMPVDSQNPRPLTDNPADDLFPAWSPDGKWIAFLRWNPEQRKTEVIVTPSTSGPERVIGTIRANPVANGQQTGCGAWVAWSPDGNWVAVPDRPSPQEPWGLFLLSTKSGEKRRITSGTDFGPAFSKDGRSLAYVRAPGADSQLFVISLKEDYAPEGKPKRLTFDGLFAMSPVWSRDGKSIFYSGGELWGNRRIYELDVAPKPRKEWMGTPLPIDIGDSTTFTISFAGSNGARLVYEKPLFDPNIWLLERNASGETANPARPVAASTRVDFFPHLSPDGNWFTFTSTRTGHQEIWIAKRDGSQVQQRTFLNSTAGTSRWSPDGRWIVFIAKKNGVGNFVVSSTGGEPKWICDGQIASWSRDSRSIYFAKNDKNRQGQVWKIDVQAALEGKKPEPVQITTNGGLAAFESPDGKAVYVSNRGAIWRVPLDRTAEEKLMIPFLDWTTFAVVNEGIVFVSRGPNPPAIQFYSFSTREIRMIAPIGKPVFPGISASGDGRTIVYSQVDRDESDLMLAELASQ